MNELMLLLGWIGIFSPMALATVGGSMVVPLVGKRRFTQCWMSESGYGKYIGISVLPSTHAIFGHCHYVCFKRAVTPEVAGGLFAVGFLTGIALMLCGIEQGICCASAINASKSKPEIFGLSITPAAIVGKIRCLYIGICPDTWR